MLRHARFLLPLLLVFAGVANAQLTTITGTIQRADGSFPSGTITAQNQQFVTQGGVTVVAATKVIPVVNGVVSTALYPNVNSNPQGTVYRITYQLSSSPAYSRIWYVPAGGPVTITQIESPPAGLVGTTAIVSPAQLTQSSATIGECLTWSGSFWIPGTCSGSGASAFNSITTGTNTTATMTVGTGGTLTRSGSGIIDANRLVGTTINSVYGTTGALLTGSGTYTLGNLLSVGTSSNMIDSGIAGSSVIVSSGSYPNPSWISSLAASKLTGALGCAQEPLFSGDVTKLAGSCATTVTTTSGLPFAPSATIDTTVASNVTSGTLGAARMSAVNLASSANGGVTGNLPVTNLNGGSGASSSTAWFGDGTWKSIAAGGTVTHSLGPLTAGAVVLGNSGADVTVVPSLGTSTTLLHGNSGGSPTWGPVALTADVTGLLPTANGGLNSASITFSGPSGGAKTFGLPNASANILTDNALVTLGQGGTGVDLSGIAKGGLIVGAAANTVAIKAVGTDGFVLVADAASPGGVKWAVNSAGTGTVTSIATTSPITGGTITATGTIACPTCVTAAAALTANQLLIGAGSQASAKLGTLGTSTTVLHGNSGGAPSFGAVSLTSDVTGTLPYANGGRGARILEVLDYRFTITPTDSGGTPNPAIGTGAITIYVPVAPVGFSAAITDWKVYISGGTGTAEARSVTGGTCTAGGINCTVILGTGNTHTGAYTLTSASGGLHECAAANPSGTCHAAAGTYAVYYPVHLYTTIKILGDGRDSTIFQAQGNVGIFDLEYSSSVFEDVQFTATALQTASTGYAVRMGNLFPVYFTGFNRISCKNMYNCLYAAHNATAISGSSEWWVTDSYFENFYNDAIIADGTQDTINTPSDNVGPRIQNSIFFNYSISGHTADACLRINATGVIMFTDNFCAGNSDGPNYLNYGVYLASPGSTGLTITGNNFQATTTAAINLSAAWDSFAIHGNQIDQPGFMTSGYGILVGTGTLQGTITDNEIQGPGGANTFRCIDLEGTATNFTLGQNSCRGADYGYYLNSSGTVTVGPSNMLSVTTPVAASTTTVVNMVAPVTYAQLGNWANSSSVYVSDAKANCSAGGGSGAVCSRVNGGWVGVSQIYRSKTYSSTGTAVSTSTGAWTSVPFNTNTYDVGSVHSASVNNTRFTAPATGAYTLSGSVTFTGGGGTYRWLRVFLNGGSIVYYLQQPATAIDQTLQFSVDLALTSADYVEIQVQQNSGGALAVQGGFEYLTSASMRLIQ